MSGAFSISRVALGRVVSWRGYGCVAAGVLLTALCSCSPERMKLKADADAYAAIGEKAASVPNMDPDFSIEVEKSWAPLTGLPVVTEASEDLGESGSVEVGAPIIDLEKALEIAVKRNRQYQSRKEALYLEALSLTLDRHQYTPIFSSSAATAVNRSTTDVTNPSDFSRATGLSQEFINELEQLTGQPADLLNAYQRIVEQAGALAGLDEPTTGIEERISHSGNAGVGLNWLLKSGGEFAVNLTSNFLRFITGDPSTTSSSALVANLTQPLLRGRGAKVAAERLTQAERNLLYELRAFTQYRKDFTVEVCSAYYGVLQNRDIVRNNWRGLQNFRQSVARERALREEGRRTPAALGRLEQAELSRENSWIESVRRYRESLDRFKIQLGLSTDESVVLDDGDMTRLRSDGLKHPLLSSEDAVQVALATRLDLFTQRDQVADAERQIVLAEDALKPSLDLSLSGRVDTPPDGNYDALDVDRGRWSAGFDTDLNLDRMPERNAYRASLITLERAEREYTLAEDNIKLDIRESWRVLEQAKRNYEISLVSVELNERRVEEQNLLAELGRATILDQVDAQNDLTSAQNDLTAALVAHTISRLQFWRDMGILFIKEDGRWEEVVDESGNEATDAGPETNS